LALFGNIIAPKSLGDTLQKKIAQRQKYRSTPKISPKWRNFAQSGHTARGIIIAISKTSIGILQG
jgi:phosphoglucomutase